MEALNLLREKFEKLRVKHEHISQGMQNEIDPEQQLVSCELCAEAGELVIFQPEFEFSTKIELTLTNIIVACFNVATYIIEQNMKHDYDFCGELSQIIERFRAFQVNPLEAVMNTSGYSSLVQYNSFVWSVLVGSENDSNLFFDFMFHSEPNMKNLITCLYNTTLIKLALHYNDGHLFLRFLNIIRMTQNANYAFDLRRLIENYLVHTLHVRNQNKIIVYLITHLNPALQNIPKMIESMLHENDAALIQEFICERYPFAVSHFLNRKTLKNNVNAGIHFILFSDREYSKLFKTVDWKKNAFEMKKLYNLVFDTKELKQLETHVLKASDGRSFKLTDLLVCTNPIGMGDMCKKFDVSQLFEIKTLFLRRNLIYQLAKVDVYRKYSSVLLELFPLVCVEKIIDEAFDHLFLGYLKDNPQFSTDFYRGSTKV